MIRRALVLVLPLALCSCKPPGPPDVAQDRPTAPTPTEPFAVPPLAPAPAQPKPPTKPKASDVDKPMPPAKRPEKPEPKAVPPKPKEEPVEFRHVKQLRPNEMEVGDSGTMPSGMVIAKIVSDDSAVVEVWEPYTVVDGVGLQRTEFAKHRLVIRGVPTAGYVDGKTINAGSYWGVVGTQKVAGYGTLFAVRPVPEPKRPEPPKPEPKVEQKPDPPPPLPKVTLTPAKDDPIFLGSAVYFVATAKKEPEVWAEWVKKGQLKLLNAPAEVEVVSRDKDYCRVKMDGKEWYVETRFMPPK